MNRFPHKDIIYTDWDEHPEPAMHHRPISCQLCKRGEAMKGGICEECKEKGKERRRQIEFDEIAFKIKKSLQCDCFACRNYPWPGLALLLTILLFFGFCIWEVFKL